MTRNSSHYYRKAVKMNEIVPAESYFYIISCCNGIIVNQIFCGEVFGVLFCHHVGLLKWYTKITVPYILLKKI